MKNIKIWLAVLVVSIGVIFYLQHREEQKKIAQVALQKSRSEVEMKNHVEQNDRDYYLSSSNAFLQNASLKKYYLDEEKKVSLHLEDITNQLDQVTFALDQKEYADLDQIQASWIKQEDQSYLSFFENDKIKLTRKIKTSSQESFTEFEISFETKGTKPNYAFLSLVGASPEEDEHKQDRKVVYFTDSSLHTELISSHPELIHHKTNTEFVGIEDRYFILALVPEEYGAPVETVVQPLQFPQRTRVSLVYPLSSQNQRTVLKGKIYFGPKEIGVLKTVSPVLDQVVDFGWFTIVAYPLLKLIKLFYSLFENYGWAIIAVTLLLKIVTFPLNYKSMKSMRQMTRLQPQIKKLQEKYKDDKVRFNQEMMGLMKSGQYNPASGCLPMLIQMPIFFALYRVLYGSFELYQAPFAFWIHDLSLKDPYFVTPILLTLIMYIQQKLTPTTVTDPVQAKMFQLMPVFFGLFMLFLPSGLTLYMLTNAVAGIFQQIYINKKLGIHGPQTVEVLTN